MSKIWTEVVSMALFMMLIGGEVLGCDVNTEFQCSNLKCIPLTRFNNSYNDCGDNSDEVSAVQKCKAPMFSCGNTRCILIQWVHNGIDDCLDGSDEVKMIGHRCDSNHTCCFCYEYVTHSECVDNVCRCQAGYYSNDIGTECIPRLMGSPCSETSECHEVDQCSYCDPSDHVCVCDERHRRTHDRRRCVHYAGLIGSPCSLTEECRVVDRFSHCDPSDSVCVCEEGHRPTEDRRRCVLHPSTTSAEITVVTICFVVICILAVIVVFLLVWLCKAYVCVKTGQCPPSNSQQLFAVVGC